MDYIKVLLPQVIAVDIVVRIFNNLGSVALDTQAGCLGAADIVATTVAAI